MRTLRALARVLPLLLCAGLAHGQTISQTQVKPNTGAVPAAEKSPPRSLQDNIDNLRYWLMSPDVSDPGHVHDGRYYTKSGVDSFLSLKFDRAGGALTGSAWPDLDITYDLGTPTLRWRNLYVGEIHADRITGDGSGITGISGGGTLLHPLSNGTGIAPLTFDGSIAQSVAVDPLQVPLLNTKVSGGTVTHLQLEAGVGQGTTSVIGVLPGGSGVEVFRVNSSGGVTATSFTGNGTGLTDLDASRLTTGQVAPARLGTGTADATTYLRGDGTWAAVSGGGTGTLPDNVVTTDAHQYITGHKEFGSADFEVLTAGDATVSDVMKATDVLAHGIGIQNSDESATAGLTYDGAMVGLNAPLTVNGLTVGGAASIDGHTLPASDNTWDLGNDIHRWRGVYASKFYGDGSSLTNVAPPSDMMTLSTGQTASGQKTFSKTLRVQGAGAYVDSQNGYLVNGSGGTAGQGLISDGTSFKPGTVTAAPPANMLTTDTTQTVSGQKTFSATLKTGAGATVDAAGGYLVNGSAGTSGQVLMSDGSAFKAGTLPGLPPSGAAGGDLSGIYPNPTVAKIQGNAVAAAAPSDGNVLTWSASGSQWIPQAVSTAAPANMMTLDTAQTVTGAKTFGSLTFTSEPLEYINSDNNNQWGDAYGMAFVRKSATGGSTPGDGNIGALRYFGWNGSSLLASAALRFKAQSNYSTYARGGAFEFDTVAKDTSGNPATRARIDQDGIAILTGGLKFPDGTTLTTATAAGGASLSAANTWTAPQTVTVNGTSYTPLTLTHTTSDAQPYLTVKNSAGSVAAQIDQYANIATMGAISAGIAGDGGSAFTGGLGQLTLKSATNTRPTAALRPYSDTATANVLEVQNAAGSSALASISRDGTVTAVRFIGDGSGLTGITGGSGGGVSTTADNTWTGVQTYASTPILTKQEASLAGPALRFQKQGNTSGASNAVASGSELGWHGYYGWDGTAQGRAGYIIGFAKDAFSSTAHGGKVQIVTTTPGTTNEVARVNVDDQGLQILSGALKFPDGTSMTTAPSGGGSGAQTGVVNTWTAQQKFKADASANDPLQVLNNAGTLVGQWKADGGLAASSLTASGNVQALTHTMTSGGRFTSFNANLILQAADGYANYIKAPGSATYIAQFLDNTGSSKAQIDTSGKYTSSGAMQPGGDFVQGSGYRYTTSNANLLLQAADGYSNYIKAPGSATYIAQFLDNAGTSKAQIDTSGKYTSSGPMNPGGDLILNSGYKLTTNNTTLTIKAGGTYNNVIQQPGDAGGQASYITYFTDWQGNAKFYFYPDGKLVSGPVNPSGDFIQNAGYRYTSNNTALLLQPGGSYDTYLRAGGGSYIARLQDSSSNDKVTVDTSGNVQLNGGNLKLNGGGVQTSSGALTFAGNGTYPVVIKSGTASTTYTVLDVQKNDGTSLFTVDNSGTIRPQSGSTLDLSSTSNDLKLGAQKITSTNSAVVLQGYSSQPVVARSGIASTGYTTFQVQKNDGSAVFSVQNDGSIQIPSGSTLDLTSANDLKLGSNKVLSTNSALVLQGYSTQPVVARSGTASSGYTAFQVQQNSGTALLNVENGAGNVTLPAGGKLAMTTTGNDIQMADGNRIVGTNGSLLLQGYSTSAVIVRSGTASTPYNTFRVQNSGGTDVFAVDNTGNLTLGSGGGNLVFQSSASKITTNSSAVPVLLQPYSGADTIVRAGATTGKVIRLQKSDGTTVASLDASTGILDVAGGFTVNGSAGTSGQALLSDGTSFKPATLVGGGAAPANMMTTDTAQTVTGTKTFSTIYAGTLNASNSSLSLNGTVYGFGRYYLYGWSSSLYAFHPNNASLQTILVTPDGNMSASNQIGIKDWSNNWVAYLDSGGVLNAKGIKVNGSGGTAGQTLVSDGTSYKEGPVGVSGTYSFDGSAAGTISSITVSNGIITAVTTR